MPKAKKPINRAIETAEAEMLNPENPAALRLRWFDRYAVLQRLLDIKIDSPSAGRPKDSELTPDLELPPMPDTPAEVEPTEQAEKPAWHDAVDEFLSDTPAKSPTQIAIDREAARRAHLEKQPAYSDLALMRNEHVGKPQPSKSPEIDWNS